MRTVILTAAFFSLATAARAGNVADKADEAEELLGTDNPVAAFETLDSAIDEFWTAAPLTLLRADFSDSDSRETFTRRADKPFAPDDHVEIFIEPLGYGFKADDGAFGIELTTHLEIRTPGGLILAKSHDFGRLQWSGPVRNRSFTGRVGIDLPDLKAGDYELHLTVTDQASRKSASTSLPFTVASE